MYGGAVGRRMRRPYGPARGSWSHSNARGSLGTAASPRRCHASGAGLKLPACGDGPLAYGRPTARVSVALDMHGRADRPGDAAGDGERPEEPEHGSVEE